MIVEVTGYKAVLPDSFSQMNYFPPVADDAFGFCHEDKGTYAVLAIGSIDRSELLFVVDDVASGVRACLAENQGLIEIRPFTTAKGTPGYATVVKTNIENYGVQYSLTFQLDCGKRTVIMNVFAEENGMAGMRDATIYSVCQNQELVGKSGEGWLIDPIEDHPVDGFPMNLSELDDFDSKFPEHPLSEIRALIEYVRMHN